MKEVPKFHEGDHVRNGEGDHDRLSDERYKLQEENKKLKSIAAESIDAAIKAEEDLKGLSEKCRDLKIRYETIVGDHASSLRFIESLKAELADLREKYNDLIMCVGKKYPGETRHETAISNV